MNRDARKEYKDCEWHTGNPILENGRSIPFMYEQQEKDFRSCFAQESMYLPKVKLYEYESREACVKDVKRHNTELKVIALLMKKEQNLT